MTANNHEFKWEVTVPAVNIKVMAQALICLNKIGKELLIDASNTGEESLINFRTLNDGKSAFCAFKFDQSFFETVKFSDIQEPLPESDTPMAAALPLAAISKLLRGAMGGSTSKNNNGKISRLRIALEEGQDQGKHQSRTSYVVFQFEGVLGERRRHRFLFNEQPTLEAIFDTSHASSLMAQPQQLHSLLDHLQTADVSLIVSGEKLKVKSYHSTSTDKEFAMLSTEMSVASQEFESYQFNAPIAENGEDADLEIELAFGLKEIKALIGFSLATNGDDLKMYFIDNGLPVQVYSNHRDKLYDAELFLSTMQTDEDAPQRILRREQLAERRQNEEVVQDEQQEQEYSQQDSQQGSQYKQQYMQPQYEQVSQGSGGSGGNIVYKQSEQPQDPNMNMKNIAYSNQHYGPPPAHMPPSLGGQQYEPNIRTHQQNINHPEPHQTNENFEYNLDPFGTSNQGAATEQWQNNQDGDLQPIFKKKRKRRRYKSLISSSSDEGDDGDGGDDSQGEDAEPPIESNGGSVEKPPVNAPAVRQSVESLDHQNIRLSLNSESAASCVGSVIGDTPQRRLSQMTPFMNRYGQQETPNSNQSDQQDPYQKTSSRLSMAPSPSENP